MGSTVINEAGEAIDDPIVTPNDRIRVSMPPVGGLPGISSKQVVLSYSTL